MIMALLLVVTMQGLSQDFNYSKITTDLLEEINGSTKSNELFQTIIVLDEQFDAQKSTRQMQHLNKVQRKEYVMSELQQVSRSGQTAILKDLHQGQKAELVKDIQSFWIINAISCSMTKDMVYAIAERPDVKYVMKDFEIHIADGKVSDNNQQDRSVNQWNITKVNADAVWAMGYTGAGIIVAVIDSGVNYNHTDIANNMWDGGSEYPNHGWDFINDDNDPMDNQGHGTHCAGTVSSYGTNGNQCGIAKDAKIMALKTLNPKPNGGGASGPTSCAWAAIEFAVSHGADILSMSIGTAGAGGNWAYRNIMENVLHCGIVAAVSAGNSGGQLSTYPRPNNVSSPGNCPSPWRHPDQTLDGGHSAVVTVGATTKEDKHSSFSSYGPSTWATGNYIGYFNDYPWDNEDPTKIGLIKPDISAPGSDIWSLSHSSNTGYLSMDGTSMAAPCVAGVMALMLSANPTLTPVEIDSIIETTAIACDGQTTKNNTFGSGRIDALAAINYMLNACAAPSNLVATINEADVTLNWNPAENGSSYCIYRNGTMIAQTVSDTTFTDMNVPAGINTYFVRSNSANHQTSLPSNQVTVEITTNAIIDAPSNFSVSEINTGSSTVTLHWDAPATRKDTLRYVSSGIGYYAPENLAIAAQRFPSSMLQPYAGMQIESIFFSLANSDATCTLNLYEGDELFPGTQVFEGSFTTTEAQQQVNYQLNTPVVINPNKDLWLTITTSDQLAYNCYDGDIYNVLLFQLSGDHFWVSYDFGIAWAFQLGLSDKEYTYNVSRNNIAISSNQNETSYTDSYINGMNEYKVTAITNSYVSPTSNTLMIVDNTSVLDSLTLNYDDKLIILSNSTLSVTEKLINTDPANLILENGAQLFHSGSDDVYATVKKDIAAYTTEKNGWNFIASPIATQLESATIDGLIPENEETTFDLYKYNEPNHKWYNYKPKTDNAEPGFAIDPKTGYLYASSENTTLSFAGKLHSASSITSNTLSYSADVLKGFNLVGNPLPFNAYVSKSYYKMNGTNIEAVTSNSETVAPCTGIIVEATGENESVIFSQTPMQWSKRGQLQIAVAENKMDRDGSSTSAMQVDNAIICFDEADPLQKFVFNEDNAKLYIPQGDEDYAIACANNRNEMPLNVKPTQDGTFTLTVQPESVKMGYLFLIDNKTGTHINLLTTPNYTFEAKTDDYESRFKLLFAAANEETETFEDESFGFIINGQFQSVIGQGLLQVIDLNGRILRSANETECIGLDGLTAGVYVIRFITANSVRTQKIVVE